jgi:hypothetical protein
MKRKLNFEFIPDGTWYYNLRSILSKKQWDFLRSEAKQRFNNRCAICGKTNCRLEAHERWDYDLENGIQVLKDVVSICHDCHSAIHYNRTALKGDVERAENHYMKVNNCSYSQLKQDLGLANLEHQKRNQVSEWKLDLSWLKRFIND